MLWWPEVTRDRDQALYRMREESAERRQHESPSLKEAEERYWAEEKVRIEEARRRRDEYLEEHKGRQG
jgi:hypothetical protein